MRKAEEKEKTQVQYKLPVIQVPAKEVAEVLESSKVSTSFLLPSLFSSLYNDNDDNDAQDDMVIEMFASWCEKCMILKPFFEKIADVFETSNIAKVMAIDGTQTKAQLDEGKLSLYLLHKL